MTLTPEQLAVLKSAIQSDPSLTSKSHVEIAKELRKQDREVPAETIDTGTLVASVAKNDRTKLKAEDKEHLAFLVSAGAGALPLTPTLHSDLFAMFNGPSPTKENIAKLVKRKGSRLDELKLPNVTESDVADALRE